MITFFQNKYMILSHLERSLGTVSKSITLVDQVYPNLHVVFFSDQPSIGLTTFSTIGLSNTILELRSGRQVRQELIFTVRSESYDTGDIASFLLTFSEELMKTGIALMRGEVVGPGDSIIPNVTCSGVYACGPVFFEKEFHVLTSTNPPTILVWLIPVLENEIKFIRQFGWDSFENELEKQNVDFWNLDRESIVI
jgi:hypothetical protein